MVIPETFFLTVVYPFLIDCLSLSRIVILYIEMCQTYTDVNILTSGLFVWENIYLSGCKQLYILKCP